MLRDAPARSERAKSNLVGVALGRSGFGQLGRFLRNRRARRKLVAGVRRPRALPMLMLVE